MTRPERPTGNATPRFELSDKVAVVTGGNSGIGRAVAELLAACGAHVAILSRRQAQGQAVADALRQGHTDAEWFSCDVKDEASVTSAFEKVNARLGAPTLLVNSAGLLERGAAQATSRVVWDTVMAVNATGTFLASREAVTYMRGAGGGAIINVSSEAGLVGIAGLVAYSAAKAAVVSLTRCMALDHAEDGVRVNCVCPGTTRTPMVEGAAARTADPEAELSRYASARPLRRLAHPSEIASAVVLLASDECAFATGSVLAVDGGFTA